eukprot:6201831-Pleurochrysis_carterae.AAC.1
MHGVGERCASAYACAQAGQGGTARAWFRMRNHRPADAEACVRQQSADRGHSALRDGERRLLNCCFFAVSGRSFERACVHASAGMYLVFFLFGGTVGALVYCRVMVQRHGSAEQARRCRGFCVRVLAPFAMAAYGLGQ